MEFIHVRFTFGGLEFKINDSLNFISNPALNQDKQGSYPLIRAVYLS